MKNVLYRKLRDGVMTRMGLDPAQTRLSSQDAALAEYLTSAVAYVWNLEDWPQTTATELRQVLGEGYDKCMYTYESDFVGGYYYIGRAPANSNFEDPVWRIKRVTTTPDGRVLNIDTALNVTWTDRTTHMYIEDSSNSSGEEIPYIPLIVLGQNPIGEILGIYSEDPANKANVIEYNFALSDSTVLIVDGRYTGGDLYVKFQLPVPQFTSEEYNSAATYFADDLVYLDSTGDCYLALKESTGVAPTDEEFWLRQRVPMFLADYLKIQAYADTLSEDGQTDKAQFQLARADGVLMKLRDDAWLRHGEVRHYSASFDFP